ncbi:sodium transport system ATP-binding protein [Natranaerovirga hydrolytica]|uniref:Sodium transport system ATP-binding protein n=1 Tax=Natranaerovirga hydrolytica TaxID=680378 RepID=A0A4R1ML87_9FIRM|nr:ABC transporter ATP-binding protein [Natranaerovirga hydrolytica]TCK93275.1 sodium transport system ATP-binding protein [Natranaerovirga hydrolytica]
MIEVKHLTKVYKLNKKQMQELKTKGNKKVAVNDLSFTAKEGEIFGLLGPNGAGKTTTLRSISTLLKPTEGQISVQGYDVIKEASEVRRRIGFLTNELKLDTHFTPNYTIYFFGKLYGLDKKTIDERKEKLFNHFGINEFAHKKIDELSTGMKQKLSIAVSLIHDPEVVIFDEPTNGLDIITARAVTEYLYKLKAEGKLVIISTHIMTVASKLCDRVGIIINGTLKAEGTIEEVLKKTGTNDLEDAFFELYKNTVKEGA